MSKKSEFNAPVKVKGLRTIPISKALLISAETLQLLLDNLEARKPRPRREIAAVKGSLLLLKQAGIEPPPKPPSDFDPDAPPQRPQTAPGENS